MGIVSGENVAAAGALGATIGGASGYNSAEEARWAISDDLQAKFLQQKATASQTLAYGILFFPSEARSAKQRRLPMKAVDTGAVHVLTLNL